MLYWLQNFLQISTEAITPKEAALIGHPKLELGVHIAYKLAELGTFAGSVVVAPIVNLLRKNKIKNAPTKFGTVGLFTGICLAPVLEAVRLMDPNVTPESIEDRCYRLRFNKKQLFIDRSVTLGAIVGYSFRGAKGMVFCIDAMLIYTVLYNRYLWDRTFHRIRDRQMEMLPENPYNKSL